MPCVCERYSRWKLESTDAAVWSVSVMETHSDGMSEVFETFFESCQCNISAVTVISCWRCYFSRPGRRWCYVHCVPIKIGLRTQIAISQQRLVSFVWNSGHINTEKINTKWHITLEKYVTMPFLLAFKIHHWKCKLSNTADTSYSTSVYFIGDRAASVHENFLIYFFWLISLHKILIKILSFIVTIIPCYWTHSHRLSDHGDNDMTSVAGGHGKQLNK